MKPRITLTPARCIAHISAYLTGSTLALLVSIKHGTAAGMLTGLVYGLLFHFPLVNWLVSSHEDVSND